MSAIFDALPPRPRKMMMIVISIFSGLVMLALAWYAFAFIQTQAGRGRLLPSLQIPVWWTLVWVPVGLFMTGTQYILTAIKNMLEPDIYLSTGVLEGYDNNEEEV